MESFGGWLIFNEMANWNKTGPWKVVGVVLNQLDSVKDILKKHPEGLTVQELFQLLVGEQILELPQDKVQRALITLSAQVNNWERAGFIKKDRTDRAHKLFLGAGKSVEQDIEDLTDIQKSDALSVKGVLKSLQLHFNRYMKNFEDGDYKAIPDFYRSVGEVLRKNNYSPITLVKAMNSEAGDQYNPIQDEFKWAILAVMGSVLSDHYSENDQSLVLSQALNSWGEDGRSAALQRILQMNPGMVNNLLQNLPREKVVAVVSELLPALSKVKSDLGPKASLGLLDSIFSGRTDLEDLKGNIRARLVA